VADPGRMVALVREQAEACAALGSSLYAVLLQRVADDVESGGPAYGVLRGHEDDPGPSALALRLMGGVHRLVLDRRAPALALTYPSVGGTGDPDAAWAALRTVLAEFVDELRASLGQPPQTNEVGRAAALVGGLLRVAATDPRPLRLVEIGTSAGLNLRADRFRIELADGRAVGPAESPVVLTDAWHGRLPSLDRSLVVVERAGCDLAPVDPRRQRVGCCSRPTSGRTSWRGSSACAVLSSWLARCPRQWSPPARLTSSTASSCAREPRPWCGTRSCGSTSGLPSAPGSSPGSTSWGHRPRTGPASPTWHWNRGVAAGALRTSSWWC